MPALGGAQLNLSETRDRLAAARALIQRDREEALRSLASALYRALSEEAEMKRLAAFAELDSRAESAWERSRDALSRLLQDSASRRWPLANRLALLSGFPLSDPARLPAAENPQDQRRRAEAETAWRNLLAEDASFAAAAQRVLEQAEADVSSRRSQIVIEFSQALNAAGERAEREAKAALATAETDAMGRFAESGDIQVPPTQGVRKDFPARPPLTNRPPALETRPKDARRRFLEQELRIWLAQNGWRQGAQKSGAPDRTREFKAWLEARNAGL